MNLMFWKKKKQVEADVAEAGSDKTMVIAAGAEETPAENLARPGLAARLRNTFSTLGQRFRKRRATGTSEDEPPITHEPAAQGPGTAPPPNLKKRLIVGAALGAVILLLAGMGFAAWKLLFSSHEAETSRPAEAAAHGSEPPAKPAHAEQEMQAQMETLKKQNEEMARQLEALKNEKARKDTADGRKETLPGTHEAGAPAGGNNEVTVFSGKDTKASAQALRQAIEEMNAAAGGGKPRKPAE